MHAHALARHVDAVLEVAQQPLRDRDRILLAAGAVEQQRELVAAEARRGVALAEAGAQAVGHGAQQLVAGVVAVAVVDRLELVDVEQQHADARPAALERVLEAVVEERAVGELGERVVERLALELVLERLQLAHGLLEAVVLERDGHVAGERLEQPQVLLGEVAVDALAARDGEQPDAAGLAVERGHHAGLHAAPAEVARAARTSWMLSVSTGPVSPAASERRLSASGSSIGSSMRRPPSRLSEERAERLGSAEKSTSSTAPTRKAAAVRASSASSSGTISDERESVRVAS